MLLFLGWVAFIIVIMLATITLDKHYYLGFWYYCFVGLLFGVVTAIFSIL